MWSKVIMIALTTVLGVQGKIGTKGYVDIDGHSYYFESENYISRDLNHYYCETLNMSAVNFETVEKWNTIKDWINANDDYKNSYWTGALKDEDSLDWYWQDSGNPISEFFWAEGEPDLQGQLSRMCMVFSVDFFGPQGWDDAYCSRGAYTMCE